MKKAVVVSLMLVGVFVLLAAPAFAAEGPDGEKADMTVLGLIMSAGVIGWVIILLSVVGLALSIEHAINLRREKLLPPEFVVELQDLFEQEDYEEALHLCEGEENFLAQTMAASMAKMDHGYESMEDALVEANEEMSLSLHQKISYVALIANIAPMLGLLGTVVGMIITFKVFAETPGAGAAELAPGIAMALVTTVMGLIVSIPLMVVFQFFRNLLVKVVLESSNIAGDLIRQFKPGQRAAG